MRGPAVTFEREAQRTAEGEEGGFRIQSRARRRFNSCAYVVISRSLPLFVATKLPKHVDPRPGIDSCLELGPGEGGGDGGRGEGKAEEEREAKTY